MNRMLNKSPQRGHGLTSGDAGGMARTAAMTVAASRSPTTAVSSRPPLLATAGRVTPDASRRNASSLSPVTPRGTPPSIAATDLFQASAAGDDPGGTLGSRATQASQNTHKSTAASVQTPASSEPEREGGTLASRGTFTGPTTPTAATPKTAAAAPQAPPATPPNSASPAVGKAPAHSGSPATGKTKRVNDTTSPSRTSSPRVTQSALQQMVQVRSAADLDSEAKQDPLIGLLTPEEVAVCQTTFNRFDISGKGRVPFRTLPTIIAQASNIPSATQSQSELEDRMAEIDLRESKLPDGCVGINDLLRLMGQRERKRRSERLMQSAGHAEPEHPKRSWYLYPILYTFLFLAHWFGANRFDLDNDGDVDLDDVEAWLRGRQGAKERMKKNFSVTSRKEKSKFTKAKQREAMALTLQKVLGRWLVGDPGCEFIVTITEGGACLYDGRYMGPDHDITEETESKGDPVLRRNDGWVVDTLMSSQKLLVWTLGDELSIYWRRVVSWSKLITPKPLAGEWRLLEDGVEDTTVIMVEDDGLVLYDGEAIDGEELTVAANPEGGNPELTRGSWNADLSRSTADVILWIQPGVDTRVSWRRPPKHRNSAESAVADLATGALTTGDAVVDLLEEILVDEVEGEAYEKIEEQHIVNMFTKNQLRPHFVFYQCLIASGMWLISTFKLCTENGTFNELFTQKAGLDNIMAQFVGLTDLRLVDEASCANFRFEVWRWLTYQFTHVGATHMMLNCILTLVLGIPIEAMVGFVKMFIMFNAGVVGGAMAYGIWDTRNTVVGMSGGCYALFGMHFAEIALNWRHMKFAKVKVLMLLVLIAVDNVNYHMGNVKDTQPDDLPSTSNAAHFGGAIAGGVSGVMIGYNEVLTMRDVAVKLIAGATGGVLAVAATMWIMTHEDPFPIQEWVKGENTPTHWYQQVYNLRCFGSEWRCARCKCSDQKCLAALQSANDGVGGWFRCPVARTACSFPWFDYSQYSNIEADDSLEFTSVIGLLESSGDKCFTDFAAEADKPLTSRKNYACR